MVKVNFVDFDDTLALHQRENKSSKFLSYRPANNV